MPKGFFISCAIDYPNAKLHMGHLYEKTIADVIARVHRLNGENVLFSVGADEHGEKVEKAAKDVRVLPQEYVDQMAADFQKLFDEALISYDRFIRTSEPAHVKAAQYFFTQLWENDDIYPEMYEGWYCVSDETFWTEKDLKEVNGQKVCPNEHCGKPVQKIKEESYFFAWSRYQEQLEKWYAENNENVFPEFRKKEMQEFMKKGLKDISFSRKNLKWCIPVPQNKEHTIYVWGDALVNYLTVAGYPEKNREEWWPADVHVIGMDINRFHSLLWPAMLVSAKESLPKQVLVHGFVNDVKGEKMSKSKGNVIDPISFMKKYGIEPIRYYMLRESPIGNDISFSEANLIERNNSELADGLGSLVYRVLSMLEKYTNGVIPKAELDEGLVKEAQSHASHAYQSYLNHDIQGALIHTWKAVDVGNKAIAVQEPWKKMKDGKREEVEKLLVSEVEILRILSILIAPVLPQTSESIRSQFGFGNEGFNKLNTSSPMGGKNVKKGNVLFTKRELSAAPSA